MRVTVTGPRGGKVDAELSAYVEAAVNFFAKYLEIDRFNATINIRIHKQCYLDDADAEVTWDSKRKYYLELCLYNDWLGALAHEMVHVKQVIRGELTHKLLLRNIDNHEEYRNVFYEREAFDLQYKMVEAFTKYKYFDH